jgi:hypothetical protein
MTHEKALQEKLLVTQDPLALHNATDLSGLNFETPG